MSVRRTVAAVTAILLAGVLAPVFIASPAVAAPNCDLGGFEIDGNLPANCLPTPFDDFDTVDAAITSSGGTYTAASKDVDATSTWAAGGNAPDKADIDTAYTYAQVGPDGHYYLYVGWSRTSNTGTGKYAVELTFSAPNVVNNPTPTPQSDRTQGGVVAYLTYQGSTLPALGQLCPYTSQANYPTSVNSDPDCTSDTTGFASAISPDGLFFEVGFDLTELAGITPDCPPDVDAATMYLRSITGGSGNGNLKAFVDPLAVTPPSTCGYLEVTKDSLNDLALDDTTVFDYEVSDGDTSVLTDDLQIGDTDEFFTLEPGTDYTIEETIPDGAPWTIWSIVCTVGDETVTVVDDGEPTGDPFPVIAGETTSCVITNATSFLTVEKQTTPDGANQLFEFELNEEPTFFLADGELETFQFAPGSGAIITETLPVGWDLDSAFCPQVPSTVIPDGVQVTTIAGQTVTCVFTNEARGTIEITKASLNDLAPDDSTVFDWSVGDAGVEPEYQGDFQIGDTDTIPNVLPGDGYTLEELIPDGAPWSLYSIICTVDGEEYILAEDGDTFPVEPATTTSCVVTNATSFVEVEKQTLPDGSPQIFDFTITDDQTFNLVDDEVESFQYAPGSDVSVTETVPEGWDLTEVACLPVGEPIEDGVELTTTEGGVIHCTFTNTQRGTIVINKVVAGINDGTFDFTSDTLGAFDITTTAGIGSEEFLNLEPGDYDVAESPVTGYDTTNLVCSTGATVNLQDFSAEIDLQPGQTVTCTFTNTERGQIIVQKVTVPDAYDQDFNFTFDGDLDFTLNASGDDEWESELIEPGSYTVTENDLPYGWTLDSISCGTVDGTTTTIDLTAGEIETCVFTNVADPGTVTLTKTVTGVSEGYQWSFDFILTEEPDGVPVEETVDNSDLPDSAVATWDDLTVGSTYTLVEDDLPFGWTADDITCTGLEDSGSETDGFQFEVTPGLVLECTVENQAIPAEVELTKTVSNVNPDVDWSFDFDLSGETRTATDDDPIVNWDGLIPGNQYTLTEEATPGWELEDIECFVLGNEVLVPDSDAELAGYQFIATPGLVLACEVDNPADPGILTVTKSTVGGNGTFEFVLTQLESEEEPISAEVTTVGGTGEVTFEDIIAGYAYSIEETAPGANWTAGVLTCEITSADGGEPFEVDPTEFFVYPGDEIACAITNTFHTMPNTGSSPLLALPLALAMLLLGGGGAALVVRRIRKAA